SKPPLDLDRVSPRPLSTGWLVRRRAPSGANPSSRTARRGAGRLRRASRPCGAGRRATPVSGDGGPGGGAFASVAREARRYERTTAPAAAQASPSRRAEGAHDNLRAKTLRLQMLVEKRHAALPGILGGLLLVALRPIVREESVRRPRIGHELDAGIRLLQLGLEAPHVLHRNARVRLAVEPEHRRLDLARETESIHPGRVGIYPLDLTVPGRGRRHAGILRGEVKSQRAPAAEAR